MLLSSFLHLSCNELAPFGHYEPLNTNLALEIRDQTTEKENLVNETVFKTFLDITTLEQEKFRTSSKMSRWRSLALTVLDMAKLSPSSSGQLAGLAGTATTLKGVQRSGSNTSEESSSEVVVVLWLPTIVSGSTPNFRSAPSSLSYSSRSFLQYSINHMIWDFFFVKQVVLGPLVYLG